MNKQTVKLPTKRKALLWAVSTATIATTAALAEPNRVTFPENIDEFEHYTTVTRREAEEILAPRDAIEAVQNGETMPYGTHVVIRFTLDGEITRYFVMERGEGWGADFPDGRTDEWQFQWFNADQSVNLDQDTARCMACHSSRADDQFLFTYDDMLTYD